MRHLVHEALLAIVVGILHGVESVNERGLAGLGVDVGAVGAVGGAGVVGTSGAGGSTGDARTLTVALAVSNSVTSTLTDGLAASVGAGQASAGGR